jgi:ribosomal-protein-alanine N-acetyltransferase
MQFANVLTPRLALVAITPAMLQSEQAGNRNFIDATIPNNWPPKDWEPHVFTMLLAQYERNPGQIASHRYITLPQSNGGRLLIGCVGAFQSETAPSECEVGYTVLPPHERQGFATEATHALIQLIRHDPRMTSIMAHTLPHLTGSIRVLEKCGFILEGPGEQPGTIRFRLRL